MKENFENSPERPATEAKENMERVENGIWRPGILDQYSSEVAAAVSTKNLKRTEDVALRILGDPKRFERPMQERIRAGRILAQLRNTVEPSVDLHHIVKSQLVHGGEIIKIDEEFVADLQKGNLDKKQIIGTDGLVTNLKDYPLYISAADCFPVGVYDPENKAIGAFHNGIYGLLNRVVENGISEMTKAYGTDPSKLKVVIAPGISKEYKLPRGMLEKFGEKLLHLNLDKYIQKTDDPEEVMFDLGNAIRDSLIWQGVPESNIELSQFNTDKNNDLFSSERKEGKDRDNNGFMIVLK